MNRIVRVLTAVIVVAMIGCGGSSPQDQLKEIAELQEKGFSIATEKLQSIDRHTGGGKQLMAEGKTEEASEAFAKAIGVLKLAQDAHIFNKADWQDVQQSKVLFHSPKSS